MRVTIDGVDAYPLQWPNGWPRGKNGYRPSAPYKVGPEQARKELITSLDLMGAVDVVISTNAPLRADGAPRADRNSAISDPGVAVYFRRKAGSERQVLACDKWSTVQANIRAVGLTVEALRSIARSGASELLDRAFTGFKALPAPGETTIGEAGPAWRRMLGVSDHATLDECEAAYRKLAFTHHPDLTGGSEGAMAALNRARDQAREELRKR